MTTYRIEMLTESGYHTAMCGGLNYGVTTIWVEAESKEAAKAKAEAENPNMIINSYIVSKEEIEAEEKAQREANEAKARKEAEKKIRKATREAEQAAAMGLTIEEYKERKKLAAKARRYENEAVKMEADIENLLKEIAWRRRRAAEIKAEIGE